MISGSPSRRRLWLFGAGNFAFNLFWQSVSLYLLFLYIDVQALWPCTKQGRVVPPRLRLQPSNSSLTEAVKCSLIALAAAAGSRWAIASAIRRWRCRMS